MQIFVDRSRNIILISIDSSTPYFVSLYSSLINAYPGSNDMLPLGLGQKDNSNFKALIFLGFRYD